MINVPVRGPLLFFSSLFLATSVLLLATGKVVDYKVARTISNLVFFNSLHIIITFYLIFGSSTLTPWRAKLDSESRLTLQRKTFLFMFGFFGLLFFTQSVSSELSDFTGHILLILAVYHLLRQSLGISLIQNRKVVEESKVEKFNSMEKFFVHSLFGVNAIFVLSQVPWLQIQFGYNQGQYNLFFSLAMLAIVVTHAAISARTLGPHGFLKKINFHLLFCLYPVSVFSEFAVSAILALHGIEYLLITQVFLTRKPSLFNLGGFLGAVILVAAVFNEIFRYVTFGNMAVFNQKDMIVLLGAFQYTHYWLDSVIFKMKDPTTLETMAPRLNTLRF